MSGVRSEVNSIKILNEWIERVGRIKLVEVVKDEVVVGDGGRGRGDRILRGRGDEANGLGKGGRGNLFINRGLEDAGTELRKSGSGESDYTSGDGADSGSDSSIELDADGEQVVVTDVPGIEGRGRVKSAKETNGSSVGFRGLQSDAGKGRSVVVVVEEAGIPVRKRVVGVSVDEDLGRRLGND